MVRRLLEGSTFTWVPPAIIVQWKMTGWFMKVSPSQATKSSYWCGYWIWTQNWTVNWLSSSSIARSFLHSHVRIVSYRLQTDQNSTIVEKAEGFLANSYGIQWDWYACCMTLKIPNPASFFTMSRWNLAEHASVGTLYSTVVTLHALYFLS